MANIERLRDTYIKTRNTFLVLLESIYFNFPTNLTLVLMSVCVLRHNWTGSQAEPVLVNQAHDSAITCICKC